MVFSPKVLWFCCGVQFLGDLRYKHHVDLITQLSSNNLFSTVTLTRPVQLYNTYLCSVSTHAQAKNGS